MIKKYPEIALERFDKAGLWIKYVIIKVKRFLKNGATMVGPGSQLRGYFPKEDEFWPIMKQTTGESGSVMLMNR